MGYDVFYVYETKYERFTVNYFLGFWLLILFDKFGQTLLQTTTRKNELFVDIGASL